MITVARKILRRAIPHGARWRLRQLRRIVADAGAGVCFGKARGASERFPYLLSSYALPVACYPGQEHRYEGKLRNLRLALGRIDGVVVGPGEVFSFWRLVGRPTRRGGYAPAAALKHGQLTEEVGGSICLASTVLYNAGLLAGMAVVERYCHSVDTYGEARYFELGRDAAVEYAYRDLRLRNDLPAPLLICAGVRDGRAYGEAWCASPVALRVDLDVGPVTCVPAPGGIDGTPGMQVRTWRTIRLGEQVWTEELGISRHEPIPR